MSYGAESCTISMTNNNHVDPVVAFAAHPLISDNICSSFPCRIFSGIDINKLPSLLSIPQAYVAAFKSSSAASIIALT